jgi:beta-1,4-mannosyl-glycoprotein beta-1,4-N-acetylglucosaminyltransferase
MVLDCFLFFNEFDMLESRLKYLDSVVDYFILIESNVTFVGKQKPLYFAENQLRFKKYNHKIIYFPFIFDNSIHQLNFDVEVDLKACASYDTVHWQIEKMQRNHIANAVKMFDGNPFVILSDVDEIPSIEAINFAKQHAANEQIPIASFFVKLFFYNFYNMDPNEWLSIIFTNKEVLIEKTPQFLRSNHRNESLVAPISNGGWHLSFFLTPEQIQHKIQNYSHQENNREEFTNIENINQALREGKSLFFKDMNYHHLERNKISEILPSNFLEAFSKFL